MSFNDLYREYLAEEGRRGHPMRRTQREMQLVNQLNKLANQYALWHRRGGSHLGNSAAMWQNYQKAMNRWLRQATEENHRRLPRFLARNLKAHHAAVERNKRLRTAPTLKSLAWNAAGLKGVTPQQLRTLAKAPHVTGMIHPNINSSTLKSRAWNAAGLQGITPAQLRALAKLPKIDAKLHPNINVPRAASAPLNRRRSLSQPPKRARSSRATSAPR
jgi:hypothetical protein